MLHKLEAEFFGTFWLVLGGCGSAVLAAATSTMIPMMMIAITPVLLRVGSALKPRQNWPAPNGPVYRCSFTTRRTPWLFSPGTTWNSSTCGSPRLAQAG